MAAVEIIVRWPPYSTQLIPSGATTIALALVDQASKSIGAANLTRKTGEATATASFEQVPAATVYLLADAKDTTGAIVASGTTTATLIPNKRNSVRLSLIPANSPVITDFSPKAGCPGTQLNLAGKNFPTGQIAYSVSLGGLAVAKVQTQAFDSTLFTFFVPTGATTSPIVLIVDGVKTTSSANFLTVGKLLLSPGSAQILTKTATLSYAVTAQDTSASSLAAPGAVLNFTLSNVTGVNNTGGAVGVPGTTNVLGSFSSGLGFSDSGGVARSIFTAQSTGSGWITVTCGSSLVATASIQVN